MPLQVHASPGIPCTWWFFKTQSAKDWVYAWLDFKFLPPLLTKDQQQWVAGVTCGQLSWSVVSTNNKSTACSNDWVTNTDDRFDDLEIDFFTMPVSPLFLISIRLFGSQRWFRALIHDLTQKILLVLSKQYETCTRKQYIEVQTVYPQDMTAWRWSGQSCTSSLAQSGLNRTNKIITCACCDIPTYKTVRWQSVWWKTDTNIYQGTTFWKWSHSGSIQTAGMGRTLVGWNLAVLPWLRQVPRRNRDSIEIIIYICGDILKLYIYII